MRSVELRAYDAGFADGLEWDLDGFRSRAAVYASDGWAESTIRAIGGAAFARLCGVEEGGPDWQAAMAAYDDGVRAGALAPQEMRRGNPPGER